MPREYPLRARWTSSQLDACLIERTVELEALVPEWLALWERTDATPFQSPAWLLPWWQTFRPGELFTVVVRREGLLVGLAPFYIEDGVYGRRLLPLGLGLTDHLDILIDGAYFESVAEAIVSIYRQRGDVWDFWCLEELAPDASARRLPIADLLQSETSQSTCPTLELPIYEASWHRTAAGRRWRRAWNRLGRHSAVGVIEGDLSNAEALLDSLIALHTRRWEALGQAGVLSDLRVQRFHRKAVPLLLRAGVLRLFALLIKDKVVGVYYGFAHKARGYGYLSGFDPDFGPDSPGTALLGHAIRDAVRSGCRTFDFLRGQEAYKYAWGAEDCWNTKRVAKAEPRAVLRRAECDVVAAC